MGCGSSSASPVQDNTQSRSTYPPKSLPMIDGNATTDATFPMPKSSDLFGKGCVAFVTGGNRGIGYQTALGLAKKGITVVIAARDEAKGQEAVAELTKQGLSAEYVKLDGTDVASIDAAVKIVSDKFGKLDILVNNAGVLGNAMSLEETPEVFRAVYETNVIAPFQVTKSFLPLLRKSERARIVNVSSAFGSLTFMAQPDLAIPFPNLFAYPSSKVALNMITVQLARELAKDNIKVNSSDPGYCSTEITGNTGPRTPDQGAVIAVNLATIGDDGPSGKFYNELGRHYW